MNNNIKINIGITSIPGREQSLIETLESIFRNTVVPEKIFITIPQKYRNFLSEYNMAYINQYKVGSFVEILNTDEDWGPCSKLLGPITKYSFDDNMYFLLLDDDHVYSNYLLETFIEAAIKNDACCYSYYVYFVGCIAVGQGADGFLMKNQFLKGFKEYFDFLLSNNSNWFYNDDLLLSSYLFNKHITVMSMRDKLKELDTCIYTFGSGHYLHGLNRLGGDLERRHLNESLMDNFMELYPEKLKAFV